QEPFILHNVDVISTIDFARLLEFHNQNDAIATLAVQQRETSRLLLFDEKMQLCGRRILKENKTELVRTSDHLQELAFSGIHVISPRLLGMLTEEGAFSIIVSYLRLSAQGESIVGFRADGAYWRDLGRPEHIRQAEQELSA